MTKAIAPPPRGDETRLRLLTAAIEIFGRHGFEASTRALSREAGVNLAAIPYHFGGKEGLYLACADHIGEQISARIGPVAEEVRNRLWSAADDGPCRRPLEEGEARRLLAQILEAFARTMVSPESAGWARFIIREQMEPTEAFSRLYEGVMKRILETARRLVGRILNENPDCSAVRLRTVSLVGQIVILRAGRAAVMRQMEWEEIGDREFALIRDMIAGSVAALGPSPAESGKP